MKTNEYLNMSEEFQEQQAIIKKGEALCTYDTIVKG